MAAVKLTPKCQKILQLLTEGANNREIAAHLHIKLRTVKSHLNRMFLRYQITDGDKRVRLAVLAYRERLAISRQENGES